MRKIFVTGNAGAGKSTLANTLGNALALPVHSLDPIVWQPGWRKTPTAEREQQIKQLILSSNEWIIEGVSQTVMDAANTIIFLDISWTGCLWRCLKRNRHYLFKSRPGLPEHCPEILIIPELLRIIWKFPNSVRPLILNHIESNQTDKVTYIANNNIDLAQILPLLQRTLTVI